jgi:hypothetical protein
MRSRVLRLRLPTEDGGEVRLHQACHQRAKATQTISPERKPAYIVTACSFLSCFGKGIFGADMSLVVRKPTDKSLRKPALESGGQDEARKNSRWGERGDGDRSD